MLASLLKRWLYLNLFVAGLVVFATFVGSLLPYALPKAFVSVPNCSHPCWNAIIPGKTKMEAARKILQHIYPTPDFQLEMPDKSGNLLLSKKVNSSVSDSWIEVAMIRGEQGFVDVIGLDFRATDDPEMPTLGHILQWRGNPSCVEETASNELTLIYEGNSGMPFVLVGITFPNLTWQQHVTWVEISRSQRSSCQGEPLYRSWRGLSDQRYSSQKHLFPTEGGY